jgi:hypothetical protein
LSDVLHRTLRAVVTFEFLPLCAVGSVVFSGIAIVYGPTRSQYVASAHIDHHAGDHEQGMKFEKRKLTKEMWKAEVTKGAALIQQYVQLTPGLEDVLKQEFE